MVRRAGQADTRDPVSPFPPPPHQSSRAATRACMQLQYQNSMAASEWELEDYDWRERGERGGVGKGPAAPPTDLTSTHTQAPHPPANRPPHPHPHSTPASATLASLVAAAADVASPRAAATAVADTGRVAAWRAALQKACSDGSDALIVSGAGGAWGLLAAAAGARSVTIAERIPLARSLAQAGVAANQSAPWAGAVRVAGGWVSSLAVGGEKEEGGVSDGGAGQTATTTPTHTTHLPTPATTIALDALDGTPLGAGLLRAADAVAAAGVAAPCATVLPSRVRILARLVDATPREAAGVDVSALASLRWGLQPERVDVAG